MQDSTHASWSWYRNLDGLPVVTDSVRHSICCAFTKMELALHV